MQAFYFEKFYYVLHYTVIGNYYTQIGSSVYGFGVWAEFILNEAG